MHKDSQRFHQLLKEIGELHDRKQEDYGRDDAPFANVESSADFGTLPWVGALIRLNDKVNRLKALSRKGSLANESAEDSMRDIAVYALIALVLFEKQKALKPGAILKVTQGTDLKDYLSPSWVASRAVEAVKGE